MAAGGRTEVFGAAGPAARLPEGRGGAGPCGTRLPGSPSAVVGVAPLLRWHRGSAGPLLLWLVLALGRPLCLLCQGLIPLAAATVPLPLPTAVALLHHRVRAR